MCKDLIDDKLDLIIDQFNESKVTHVKIYPVPLNKIHPFYERNGRTSKIFFADNDKIIKLINGQKI